MKTNTHITEIEDNTVKFTMQMALESGCRYSHWLTSEIRRSPSGEILEITNIKGVNLKVGEDYIIDKGFSTSGTVVLVRILGRVFGIVGNGRGYTWETSLYRLTPTVENNRENLISKLLD